ncbi:MAG: ATP phosphoribosyltransferase [Eubacteriales bacterium]
MLKIALPKGRLGMKVYEMLAECGYECGELLEDNRKLIFENPENGVSYFLVKPSDVAIYVEHGAADIGVVGKDILLEQKADIYELLDLGFGKCRMCVAAPVDYREDRDRPVKVATKFPNIATEYYSSKNQEIEIIELHGSIEIAPLVGLSDVIVDIVETGTTLRENNLRVFEEIVPISARLIANKAASKFKSEELFRVVEKLKNRG